jgi:hypothetical protein
MVSNWERESGGFTDMSNVGFDLSSPFVEASLATGERAHAVSS